VIKTAKLQRDEEAYKEFILALAQEAIADEEEDEEEE
jgi:hypothetical protein